MAAKVDTEFSNGFFLTEEALAKIEELTRVRLFSDEGYSQKFDVQRVDDAVVTYERSSDVVQHEENSKRNAVKGLIFESKGPRGTASLSLEKGEKSRLIIESDDRDRALLLSSDLKEYLKSEVFVNRFAAISNFLASRIAFPSLFLITIIPIMIFSFWINIPDPINPETATDSQKLDYLFRASLARREMDFIPTYFTIGILAIPFLVMIGSSSVVYPAYTFYWGKEVSKYNAARAVRGRIFWGVIVALAVGIAGAYLSKDF